MAAEITVMRTPAELRLGEQFRTRAVREQADALAGRRETAFADFSAKGLPHRRIEAWHYTDLRSLMREALPPAEAPGAAAVAKARAYLDGLPPSTSHRVVLLDGMMMPDLSSRATLPPGVTLGSVLDQATVGADLLAAEKLGSAESILALNGAFLQGGAALSLADGASLPDALELLCLVSGETPSAVTTRSLIELGAQSVVTVVERHVNLGEADSQNNHVLVVAVGLGASLDHVAIIEGFSPTSLHLGTVLARLGADARFNSFTLTATPGVTRRQGFLEFAGEHSSATFNGVSLLDGRSHADTTLLVTHTAAHCESREYYKTILDDESTGVYQGKVVVSPGAQKTDGKMLSKAIFLADGASMYNKPELEIFADDVVCGHGATVGNLDENQLFYLRARGIPLKDAQSLLLNAFAADAIEAVADEAMRDDLTRSVETWLRKRQS